MSQASDAPAIISAAITGGAPITRESSNLPRTPEEIGHAAVEAWREGAAIVHLHARNDNGDAAWEAELFDRSLSVIRDAGCDAVVNLTTSWGGIDENTADECRFAPLQLKPDVASFDCGTMNFGEFVFHNSPDFLRRLARAMLDAGVKPELEIFDTAMIGTALRLADEGLLEPPLFFQLVLGVQGGAPATAKTLLHLSEMLPNDAVWSVCAIGRAQLPVNVLGAAMGGHVRTGLEDNLMLRRGVPATNAQLVARARQAVELLQRPVATPAQAREILGLGPRD